MITSPLCGLRSEHIKNPVFRRPEGMPYWILMRFHTPFFYVSNGNTLYGKAGQFLLHSPQTPLIHGGIEGGFCNDWLYFDGDDAEDICRELRIPVDSAFDADGQAAISFTVAIETVDREQKKCLLGYTQKISSAITSALVDIGRACRHEAKAERRDDSHSKQTISRVHSTVARSCAKPWTLTDMAELSGYSVSRFCGLYKKQYGISPTDHLIQMRIARAKHLLSTGVYNVSETAELCGFSSLHYFSLTFKKRVGCSPSLFISLSADKAEE